jgi:hypothetical protein
VDSRNVYWVGHSLLNSRDAYVPDGRNAMEMVAELARGAGFGHEGFDHTHYGSSLAALWRGKPLTYDLSVPDALERRRELLDNGNRYDALVMTEGLPVRRTVTSGEYSAFHAQAFYCALIQQNPEARVYLYESWNNFQAADPGSDYGPPHRWDFRKRLDEERPYWERVADLASTGKVPAPGLAAPFERLFHGDDGGGGCEPRAPIFLVPVGTVLGALHDRLTAPGADDDWTLPNGDTLTLAHLFQNPRARWPESWPIGPDEADPADAETTVAALPLLHPEGHYDDVHASQVGIYIVALTHFAVLYRRSPLGLDTVSGIPEGLAKSLQQLVWQVVLAEPRTGVARYPPTSPPESVRKPARRR